MMAELDSVLDKELRDAIEKDFDLALMRTILVKYREKGFGSASVYEMLDAMRSNAAEDAEDRILELMDIVSGFCSSNMRVW
ncbi:hypothetical protein F4827_002391 [Paraburkholderia bannensis]|uniref:Uncharacterized protein n=1 Tax=Paraburkholderia bannensis TaxID=765414 RepID=A0A7W9WSH7_9BURK|nr:MULTISPECIES: hypothetical protein [Paraburkholderia]MBB3257526.1 hypothetical protein [Paraburkholderia sp. WP4_3_2]MBB6102539.1 hypothetical protein [Paraburkholderia bannensis]